MSLESPKEHDQFETSPDGAAGRPSRRAVGGPGQGDAPGTEKRGGGAGEGPRPPQCGQQSRDDAAISFDPAAFDPKGSPNNIPFGKTTTGGEDWLTVNLYVNHQSFESFAKRLDDAQSCAAIGIEGDDELQFGDVRFLMDAKGVRQGSGSKAIHMRWRMTSEQGLTMLLLNRAEAHDTLANVQIRAGSLLLMRAGFSATWNLMQYCVEAMGADLVKNKLSRVDACADLSEMHVSELTRPFNQGWIVSRARDRGNYEKGTFMNGYMVGRESSGFTLGQAPLMMRAYDKLREVAKDFQKLAVMKAHRWDGLPSCATRVEFELHRGKLKTFGVDTVDDWLAKRADILDQLTKDWCRLTAGPVDRNHADRAEMHPAWEMVRAAFSAWAGPPQEVDLTPLPTLWLDTSRAMAMAVGIFKGAFARVGTQVVDNEQFYREVMFAVRQAVGDRDMAAEITRRALELGVNLDA